MNSKNVKMIIFDLDDTLVDTYNNEWKRVKKSAFMVYKIRLKKSEFTKYYGISNFTLQMSKMLNKDKIEEFINCFKSLIKEIKYRQIIKNKEIYKLKEKKIIIGIISNSRREKAKLKMSRDLENLFDFVYYVEDLEEAKPNAKIIEKVLKEYNVFPEECCIVGDSKCDYDFAINGKTKFVKVDTGNSKRMENVTDYKNVNKFIRSFIRERNKQKSE